MREFVLAMRAVWASWNDGDRLDFQGDFYTHTLMTPVFAPRPHEFGAPRVFLAAVGEMMTEVAGEVADGVITHGVSSPRYLREVTLPALQRGLERSGRTRADVEVTCPGFIAVADTEEQLPKARAAMRRHLAYYASTPAYRPVLDLHGLGDLQLELYACSKRGQWEAMAGLVDDEMLDAFTIVATPDTLASEVRRGLRRSRRPDQRLVVAQGLVARRERGAPRPVSAGQRLRRCRVSTVSHEVVADGTTLTVGQRERVVDLGAGGGAFAAYVEGECVIDVCTGDAAPGVPWSEGTRAVDHVGHERAHRALRPRARRSGRARRRRAGHRPTGPSSRRGARSARWCATC